MAKLLAGWGYWDVTKYPYGGDFRRSGTDLEIVENLGPAGKYPKKETKVRFADGSVAVVPNQGVSDDSQVTASKTAAKRATDLSLRAQELISQAFRNGDPTKTLWRQLKRLEGVSDYEEFPNAMPGIKKDIVAIKEAVAWLDAGGNIEDIREALETGYHYGAEMIHSDNELGQKMEPAVPSPEAGPANDELHENSHPENGASPVLDGDLHSPERANVNAIREAIETQAEMEVGKPVAEKQEEVKAEEAGKSVEIDAKPGKQIIINIASEEPVFPTIPINQWEIVYTDENYRFVNHEAQLLTTGFGSEEALKRNADIIRKDKRTFALMRERYLKVFPEKKEASENTEPVGGEDKPITSGHGGGMFGGTDLEGPALESWDYPGKKTAVLSKTAAIPIEELKKAGQEFLNRVRTAAVRVSQGEDAQGFRMVINLGGREYVLRGKDADDFHREYAMIPKPEAKVNALVEKYLWKLQPYGPKQAPQAAPKPKPIPSAPDKKEDERYTKEKGWGFFPQTGEARVGSKTAAFTMRCPWCGGVAKKETHEDTYKCTKCPWRETRKAASMKKADEEGGYQGWTNWATWHVNLLLDNTESTYNSKRNLALNALRKGIGIKQLAGQFSRLFKKQLQETQDFYEENAAAAREERGTYERQQLEGTEPESTGDEAQDMANKLFNIGYDLGMRSNWEEPMGEVNWEEIAQSAVEGEKDELKAAGKPVPEPKPEQPSSELNLTEKDKKRLKEDMKIESSKHKDAASITTMRLTDKNRTKGGEWFVEPSDAKKLAYIKKTLAEYRAAEPDADWHLETRGTASDWHRMGASTTPKEAMGDVMRGMELGGKILNLLEQGPKTTAEIETLIGGGKYTNLAWPLLKDLQGRGLIRQKQMRWYVTGALSVPDKHQLRIAIDTLKAPDAMVGVMGGMDKEQALQVLAKHGLRWDDADYMAGGKGVKKAKLAADNPIGVDKFTAAYLEAALWTMPAMREPSDPDYNETPGDEIGLIDLPEETVVVAKADCDRFQQENAQLLQQAYAEGGDAPHAGHDFLLTRNGHGAGFWDGDYSKELGDALTKASKIFGENDLYLGDDGKAYWYSEAKTASKTAAEDSLSYEANANGYMLFYKGKPIGGAGVRLPRENPLRGGQARANLKMFSQNAQDSIAALRGGRGEKRFLDVMARIDAELGKTAGENMTEDTKPKGVVKNQTELEKEAGFNFFFPGQVLKEFYPEIQHEIVDYPNATNTPMGVQAPEMVGEPDQQNLGTMIDNAMDNIGIVEAIQLPADVGEVEEVHTSADYSSTSPAGAMGIGRDGKPEVLEGAPLRKENDIRGLMFTDEFYGNYGGVPGSSLQVASKNAAGSNSGNDDIRGAGDLWREQFYGQYEGGPSADSILQKRAAGETEVEQFSMFLKKVCGEIAATMTSAFKVTSRPLLDKVPGVGEIQLSQIEQPQPSTSAFNLVNTGSRVKYLLDKLTDSEIQDAINDSWAQSAVWHDGPKGGFVYEVFVRMESIDTDSMIARYKFVTGTRE